MGAYVSNEILYSSIREQDEQPAPITPAPRPPRSRSSTPPRAPAAAPRQARESDQHQKDTKAANIQSQQLLPKLTPDAEVTTWIEKLDEVPGEGQRFKVPALAAFALSDQLLRAKGGEIFDMYCHDATDEVAERMLQVIDHFIDVHNRAGHNCTWE